MTYRTVQNDTLDLICWRYYQRTDVVIRVLEANPGLCERPVKLPPGLMIELPELSEPASNTRKIFS